MEKMAAFMYIIREIQGIQGPFGWVPTRDGDDDKNSYLWGGTFVPHEVFQREDGTLGVKPLDSVMEAFSGWEDLFSPCMKTIDTKQERVLCEEAGVLTALETYLTFEEGTRETKISTEINQ